MKDQLVTRLKMQRQFTADAIISRDAIIAYLIETLREARTLIDDWAEEYGHGAFPPMRDKIDAALAKAHI